MDPAALASQIDDLIDLHRPRCLWFLRFDYYPATDEERLGLLEAIQKKGGLDAFRQAGELKKWLLHGTNETSAAS
jgi:hypothetical protein